MTAAPGGNVVVSSTPGCTTAAALEAAAPGAGPWQSDSMPLQLADFECDHGRLPGDAALACDCWAGKGGRRRVAR